ncbi:hypothetical protein [uncultured Methylobacterium sp.]|uniref:hypothetical protein n=1 Tax=uncultured Methylobacterium sp. TaxID=157278 RepID=UPI0035CAD7EC
MRADVAAAYFDCRDTREFVRRVSDGEAPRPTAMRGSGRGREPIWALEACRLFIARRHQIAELEAASDNVADLI